MDNAEGRRQTLTDGSNGQKSTWLNSPKSIAKIIPKGKQNKTKIQQQYNKGSKPKWRITFKYWRKSLRNSGELKQECNVAAKEERLILGYSELENRKHGGNYFYKLGTGGASGRI